MTTIPMTNAYDFTLTTDHVLVTPHGTRVGIGAIPKGKSGRQVHQGPMVPGPWAYTFGLCTVMTANPAHGTGAEMNRLAAQSKVHHVATGDTLTIDGMTYTATVYRRDYIRLDAAE